MKKYLLMLIVAVTAASMSLNARTVIIDEGFENGIQESEWTQEYVLGEMAWSVEGGSAELSYPSTSHEGSYRAYLRNNTSETLGYKTRLVSKVMDLRPTKVYLPELTFWYANPKWGADRDTLRVLYRTGARNAWKQLTEISTASSEWKRIKLRLPEVGQTYQIAFEGTDNLGHGIVLDEIKLQSSPECTIPYDLMATSRGAGKVHLTWSASFDADNFEVIVSRDTIEPDLVAEVEAVSPERIIYHDLVSGDYTSVDLNLEAGEFYLAYVRSLCEEENSAWSSEASKDGPFGFWVRVAKQIPFTEKFNYPSSKNRDDDWSWGNNLNNVVSPYVNSSATGNARGNFSPDTTAAVVFSGALNSPSTFIPADRYVYMATPALADTLNPAFKVNQCQVHFWSTVYTNTGRQYGRSIMVGVMDDPDDITTFKAVDTVSVWGNKTFVENIVDLGSYTGNGSFVAFVSDFDRDNLFFIDNLTIEYRKTVNKVTKISVNPRDTYATISWEGNASSYNVLVTSAIVNPNDPDDAVVVDEATVSGNSYVCRELEADHSWNRPYYVYVQAEGQEWSYRYPFVTIAAQRAIPYAYDFEARTTTTYKIGTANQQYATGIGIFGNSGNYPAVVNDANQSYVGSGYLYMSKRGGTDAWITLPMVENTDSIQVKFYLSGSSTYSQAHATIGIMSNPMDINTFVPVSSYTLNTTGYTRCYANFENYSGPEGVIAIVWDDVRNMTANTINYIDEIVVEELSDCVPPTNIELTIEPDSVSVTWEASALSDEWEIFISRTALTDAQRAGKSMAEIASLGGVVVARHLTWSDPDAAPRFGFGNLLPHANYYMYVRATCDMGWWAEAAFSTPCREEEFPYKETFENYNANSQSAGCWQLADYMGVDYPRIYQAGTSTSSNKTLELYSSGTTHRSVAILPQVAGSLTNMLLSFDVRTYAGSASSAGMVIVGTMEDIENQDSFVPFDTLKVNGADFKKARFILSNYSLAYDNLAITSGLGTLAMNSDILIDNVELKDPSCIEAYDIKQVGPAPHTVDIVWNGMSANDEWEVVLLSKSVSIASITNDTYDHSNDVVPATVVTGKSFHADGLATQTTYYAYIRTLCGDSVWNMLQVHTTCELLDPSKANRETFESYSEGSVPGCWTVGSTSSSSTTKPYVTAHGGTNILYLKQSSCTSWAASPELKCDSLTLLMVTFSSGASLSSEYCVFGVMTDPDDLSTFVALDSVAGAGSSAALQTVTYDLSEYAALIPAGAKYCAWRGRPGKSDWVYLDDVSFVSNACPMPKQQLSELTTTSIRINSGLGTAYDWILLVTDRSLNEGHLDGSVAIPSEWIVYSDTLDRPNVKVTGLQGQTKYYVHMASLCDSVTMSQWKSIYFTTPCEAMDPEDMGTITFGEEDGFTTGTGGEMPCWTVGSKTDGVSDTYIPHVENNSGTMHNGKNYLQLYDYVSSSSSYVGAYAVMPVLDVDSISKYQVNFWGRSNSGSSYNSQVIVGIITDPTDLNTFVAIDTLNLSKNSWDPYSVGFETYESDYMGDMGKNIMFLSDFGVTNYAYISEISVELIPHCRAISSFTVDSVGENSAVVSWKGYQDSYRLLLADRVLTETEKPRYHYLLDTLVDRSENIRISGLEAAATYYVYAQGICDGGDSTAISMVYASVRTSCPTEGGAALPFYDDFESYDLNDPQPGCWQLLETGTHSTWFAVKTVSSSGTKAIDVYSTSSNGCYMVVPRVNGNLENLRLTFDARSYGGSTAAKMYVGVMADVHDVTTFQLLKTFDLAARTEFTHCSMDLGEYELPYDNLIITAGIPGVTPSTHDVYLDNVGLELVATCNSPKLKSIGASYNSVEIGITRAGKEDSRWELVTVPDSVYASLGAAAMAAYLESAPSIIADTTSVVIGGLTQATSYYIYARTLCNESEISSWTRNPLKVSTRFYFADSYFFGFEKTELWERSPYSQNDNYYLHPALEAGRDSLGAESQAYMHYPHSIANTSDQAYSRTGEGALLMYAKDGYYGSYIIFPSLGEPRARSFEFKVRPGYHNKTTDRVTASTEGLIEIGVIDNGRDFSTYQTLASVRINPADTTVRPTSKNNQHFKNYTLDLDSALMADKQLVLHMPKQPMDSASLFFDDVTLGALKGFSLVALKKIVADGESALIEWQNIGGPWNLYVETAAGDAVQQFLNLSGVTSQVVEHLEPQTDYVARLERAGAPTSAKNYVTNDHMEFRTLCQAMNPDKNGSFVWNFDDDREWEANDVLAGDIYDSLYLKPSCFQTGITYDHAVNGYQWLVQRKGYEYYGSMTGYNSSRHYESGREDSRSLRVHTTDANFNSYIVLPELNCSLDTMMIEFYGRCFVNYDESFGTVSNRGKIVDATYLGKAYSQSVVVGTLTDPKDLSSLRVIDTLTYSYTDLTMNDNVNDDPLHYWELMQLPLAGAQGKYIVLFQPAAGLFYLDDLSIKSSRNILFKPSHTQTTDITASSATLSWSVWHPGLSSVVVVLNGAGEEVYRNTLSGTQCQVNGLDAAAVYEWYVYQTDGTNESPATKPLHFTTECVTNTPDYTCGFEEEQGWTALGDNSTYKQTLCWTYGDAIQGEWKTATYDPYNQQNSSVYKYSYEGEYAAMLRASYNARGNSYQPYIAMPAMEVTAYDTLQVMFWMRPAIVSAYSDSVSSSYTGSTYAKSIIVGTMTDPADAETFVPVDTVTYDGTLSVSDKATAANNWLFQQMKVELVGATGPYIAFMTSFKEKGGTVDKTSDYVWIDNISFAHKQECKDPVNLSVLQLGSEHAVLTWNGIDSAAAYLVQVSTDPFFSDDRYMVFDEEVESNTCTVKGLTPQTTYVWRVQAVCGERWGESSFSQKASFKTSRSPYFLETFATTVSTSEWLFSKTHAENVLDGAGTPARGSDNWTFARTTVSYGLEGPHYAAPGHFSDYHWMITPNFYLPENDSVHFSMDLAMTACNSAHLMTGNAVTENDMMDDYYFMIIVSDDGGQTWKSENILAKWQNTNPEGQQLRDIPSDGMTVRYSMAGFAGKNIRIGLYREAVSTSSTGIAIHVDNIRLAYFKKNVDYASACQYEDVQVDDIYLSGDDTKPGIHAYPTCFYASDADAKAGVKDSVQQLEIEVYPAMETVFTDTICEGETYTNHDFLPKDRAGVYHRKLHTAEHGCDSIVTLYLNVKERRYGEDTEVELCKGTTYEWNGHTYNRAGLYRDTLVSSIGCDSVMTLVIRNAKDTTIFDQTVITPEQLPFTYKNLDHPYAQGQAWITYPVGTPVGTYKDTVLVTARNHDCPVTLIHTLIIRWEEGIDNLFDGMGEARKFIYRDQLYIICNDEWYNALGQKVADPRR